MMERFRKAFDITLKHEGGYVDDPLDKGGETYKGISRRHWKNWEGWKLIDIYKTKYKGKLNEMLSNNPSLQGMVQDFYYEKYWMRANLYQLPELIANEIFDTGVNQGLGTAVKYFQEALNLLNNNQRHYNDILVDGGIGFKSLLAFKQYMATALNSKYRTEAENIKILLKAMNGLQFMKYVNIVKNKPGQEKYFYGWLKRT